MAQIEAQDVMTGKSYSDGKRVFKVKRTTAIGWERTQIVTKGGAILNLPNDAKLFDSANDIK